MRKSLFLILIFVFFNQSLIFPIQKSYKRAITPNLSTQFKLQLSKISRSIKQTKKLDYNTLNLWKGLIVKIYKANKNTNIDSIIQSVLHDSYQENQESLKFHADQIKFFNKIKEDMRDYIQELRNTQSRMNRGSNSDRIMMKLKDFSPVIKQSKLYIKLKGKVKLKRINLSKNYYIARNILITFNFITKEIEQIEDKLKSMEDDAQLANIRLQNAMQRQQQTIQTLNYAAKVLLSTAMAAIRKIS